MDMPLPAASTPDQPADVPPSCPVPPPADRAAALEGELGDDS
ncbi:hypothetical protein [Chitinilyticum piscinae]|nr:hypothetical protein [Chitinilyticum piscinae]